jgi:hypothetical protein
VQPDEDIPEPPDEDIPDTAPPCNICGSGFEIGNPNGKIGATSCAEVQNLGDSGGISSIACNILQITNRACACVPIGGIIDEDVPEPEPCNICSSGFEIGNPHGILVHDTRPIQCAEAQSLGDSGGISSIACNILQNSNSACHCVPTGYNGKGKGKGKGKGIIVSGKGKGKGIIVSGKGKGKGIIVSGKGKGEGKRVSEDWRPSRWTALP